MTRPYFKKVQCTLIRLQFCCKTIEEYNIIKTIRIKINNIKILLNNINNSNDDNIDFYYDLQINCNKIYKAINHIKDEQIKQLLYEIVNELTLTLA